MKGRSSRRILTFPRKKDGRIRTIGKSPVSLLDGSDPGVQQLHQSADAMADDRPGFTSHTLMSPLDLSVTFPSAGVIRLRSGSLFGDAGGPTCRRFLERVFQAEVISSVTIREGDVCQADLRYGPRAVSLQDVVQQVVAALVQDSTSPARPEPHGDCLATTVPRIASATVARDGQGTVRYYRHDSIVTGWQVRSEWPGRIRLKNPVLFRKSALCRAIERELMGVLGVDRVLDEFDHVQRAGELRPESIDQGSGDRDPRRRPGGCRATGNARPVGPPPADLYGLASPGGVCSVRRRAVAAGRGGALRLHVGPHAQGGAAGLRGGKANRRGLRSTRW